MLTHFSSEGDGTIWQRTAAKTEPKCTALRWEDDYLVCMNSIALFKSRENPQPAHSSTYRRENNAQSPQPACQACLGATCRSSWWASNPRMLFQTVILPVYQKLKALTQVMHIQDLSDVKCCGLGEDIWQHTLGYPVGSAVGVWGVLTITADHFVSVQLHWELGGRKSGSFSVVVELRRGALHQWFWS